MDINYDSISMHLDINKAIIFLKNLKNKQNNFNNNFWNTDIYNKQNYNNYIRTLPYFWLNNDKYTINKVYNLNELKEIPWYYDFRIYEDVLENMNIIDKKKLFHNFDYTEIYKNNNILTEINYIANKEILKSYIPRGYIIPPFDKNILNINNIKKEKDDDKVELFDKNKYNNDKYIEIESEIKDFVNNNVDDLSVIININKIKNIANKNFALLDTDNNNYINYNELKKLYLNLDKEDTDVDIIEKFANIIDLTYDDEKINNLLIKDNIYLVDNNIDNKNYINSVILSYVKSKNFEETLKYNNSINLILTNELKDKIKNLEESKSENYIDDNSEKSNIDNSNEKKNKNENENDNEIENENEQKSNYNDIHYNSWKETLIKIGLWTIGIITIICILIFILFAFIFNNTNDVIQRTDEIITSSPNIEE